MAIAQQGFWDESPIGGERTIWRYFHADLLGSTAIVSDAAGDVVSSTRYHPYGVVAESHGIRPTLGYTGAENEPDQDLGLIRMGARYYAPALGRWITPDRYIGENPARMASTPFESGLYGYALNNPIVFKDPDGRQASGGAPSRAEKRDSREAVQSMAATTDSQSATGRQEYHDEKPLGELGQILATGVTVCFAPGAAGLLFLVGTAATSSDSGADRLARPESDWDSANVALATGGIAKAGITAAPSLAKAGAAKAKDVAKKLTSAIKSAKSALAKGAKSAAKPAARGGALAKVPDFANSGTAARHFAKHAKGVIAGPNGALRAKPGGADVPEFGTLREYVGAAREFHSGAPGKGVLEGVRGNGDFVRFDPSSGLFGIRTQGGTIRTFFRPDGDAAARLNYFYSQF